MAEPIQQLSFDDAFAIGFHRTLRVPDDGRSYPLPPGLGTFPIFQAAEHAACLPPAWRSEGHVFIPLYQREALWIGFRTTGARPRAVKVAVGGVNALSGAPHDTVLRADPQDYLVCPPQIWLDGVRTERGTVRQFVAVPLGRHQTVEAGVTGAEVRGGLQIAVFSAKPGAVPEPAASWSGAGPQRGLGRGMGFGAGGRIEQKIYPDPHGVESWDTATCRELEVHVLNSEEFSLATGRPPPPTPIDAAAYVSHGLPWFRLFDEERGDVGESPLSRVRTLAEWYDEQEGWRPDELNVVTVRPSTAESGKARPPLGARDHQRGEDPDD